MRYTLATLLAITFALASAQNCTNGYDNYTDCELDVVCDQSFPESCECANNRKTECGAACGVTPVYELCIRHGPGPIDICVTKCVNNITCPLADPDGCECQNNALIKCRSDCGESPPNPDDLFDCSEPAPTSTA